MAAKDPVARVLSARQAAAERWGRTVDRSAATQPARDALMARFERQAELTVESFERLATPRAPTDQEFPSCRPKNRWDVLADFGVGEREATPAYPDRDRCRCCLIRDSSVGRGASFRRVRDGDAGAEILGHDR
jgi:hypothetical protein